MFVLKLYWKIKDVQLGMVKSLLESNRGMKTNHTSVTPSDPTGIVFHDPDRLRIQKAKRVFFENRFSVSQYIFEQAQLFCKTENPL